MPEEKPSDDSAELRHNDHGLAVEAFQPDRDPEKRAAAVVEGDDVFFPDPIQTTVRREPQPSWSAEAYRAVRCKDPYELPGHRVVLAHAGHGV